MAKHKEYPSFAELKPIQQLCIMLKAQGFTYQEIHDELANRNYKKPPAVKTMNDWFYSRGRLFQAYTEYNETQADIIVTEAKLLVKHLTREAAATLAAIMRKSTANDRDRIRAGQILMAKYLPDKQIVLGQGGADDDLPEELAEEIDKQLGGGADDNPPADAGDGQEIREQSDESVPPPVFQQPEEPDRPSDPPA